jgi:23S rRNA pseudouridine1911/1915/1917 synthase
VHRCFLVSLNIHSFTVTAGEAKRRLDQYLTTHLVKLSRARVQDLIEKGLVRVNGVVVPRASLHLKTGDQVEAEWTPAGPLKAQPEDIHLDALYEDDDLVVINKPSGMAVHSGGGIYSGTLVNALLHRFQSLSRVGGEQRPGLVHRLDRLTSGALVVAKNDVAHRRLAAQFAGRRVEKYYLALVQGAVKKAEGEIAAPIGRDLVRRVRMTARRREGAPGVRSALSRYRVLQRYSGFDPLGDLTLLEVKISTGRMHQIRVHLSSIGHPVIGDTMYGARGGLLDRNFLHARRLIFTQPTSQGRITVTAPLPDELEQFLLRLGPLPSLI